MFSRRDFLRAGLHSSTLATLAPTIPAFLAATARAAPAKREGRILVVIQLSGGNDGINTVVPIADEGYTKYRKILRLPKDGLLKINNEFGLHPSMPDAAKLLESGRLAIIHGVGYPNPSRSHFKSMAIWHSANAKLPRGDVPDADSKAVLGWIGQALDGDRKSADGSPGALYVGSGAIPAALRGRRSVASAMSRPEDSILTLNDQEKRAGSVREETPFSHGSGSDGTGHDLAAFVRRSTLDAYTTSERMADVIRAHDGDSRYPATGLSGRLKTIARLIKGGVGARVFYTSQNSYDTHYVQLSIHADLLGEFSGALRAFMDDLAAAKLADRVLVLCFSEFGRRVQENGSQGTDHGTAGPVFLAGPKVKAELLGEAPKLLDLQDGDLKMTVDFRRIYASVLRDWLDLPSQTVLDGDFEPFPLIHG
jgi:uncharacterized protein (DUF1501 family)